MMQTVRSIQLLQVLNEHAPLKMKALNNKTFIAKEFRKEIMKRSKLKNLCNKNKTQENWCKYKIQLNYCVNLLCKTRKNNIIRI